MKRALSNASMPASQKGRSDGAADGEDDADQGFYLKHQNRALAAELHRYKRSMVELHSKLVSAQAKRDSLTASNSLICRAWELLESDVKMLTSCLEESPDAISGPADPQEKSLLDSILTAAEEFANSVPCSDPKAVLESLGVVFERKKEENGSKETEPEKGDGDDDGNKPRALLALDGSSSYSGEDLQKETAKSIGAEVEAKKSLVSSQIQRLVSSLQKALARGSEGERKVLLRDMHARLMAEKMRQDAQIGLLKDSLALSLARVKDAQREVQEVVRDRHMVARKLDRLAASGVVIPEDMVAATGTKNESKSEAEPKISLTSAGGGGGTGVASSSSAEVQAAQGEASGKATQNETGQPLVGQIANSDKALLDASSAATLEALKHDLEAEKKLSSIRLKDLEQVTKENVQLHKQLNEILSSANFATVPQEGDKLGAAADAASGNAALLDEMKRRLESEAEKCALAQQQLSLLERNFEDEKVKVQKAEEVVKEQMEQQRQRWKDSSKETLMALEKLQNDLDMTTVSLEKAREEVKSSEGIRAQLKDYDATVKSLEAEIRRRRAESERQQETIERLEASEVKLIAGGTYSDEDLKSKVSEQQATIAALMSEVDTSANAYQAASEMKTKLLEQQAANEELVSRLTGELNLLKQRHALYSQERGALEQKGLVAEQVKAKSAEAVKLAKEQMELIKSQLNGERERCTNLMRELHMEQMRGVQAREVAEKSATELQRIQSQLSALQERCDSVVEKYEELKERARRAEETASTAQKKADRKIAKNAARMTTSSDDDVVKDLMERLRCGVCSTNYKACIIAKCFHMFCKECVDENLRIRHRKCPACGKGFGQDDVHAIYL